MKFYRKEILHKSSYGIKIYAHILRQYYPNETVIKISGRKPILAKNPFRNNTETLCLELNDSTYLFHDTLDGDFKGDPFDFAEQHYQLKGDNLLEKISQDLHIQNQNQYSKDFITPDESIQEYSIPTFSYFTKPVTNTIPFGKINLNEVYTLIRSNKFSRVTTSLRSIDDKAESRKFKAENFDYITFSGIFTKRSDKSLIRHSGLLTVDFDHVSNLHSLKESLINDEYFDTELLFTSPSGDGLKWIISIDITQYNHQYYFKAITNYIKKNYHLDIDQSGKDISRACFLPADSSIFINPKYL